MSGKPYHWCVVPMCKNTARSAPDKIFIAVPKRPQQRKQWLQLARRNADELSLKSSLYFCEDHFDVPNDVENYLKYQLVGLKKIKLKEGCLPSKFECQPDRRKRTGVHTPQLAAIKRHRLQLITELTETSSSIAAVHEETSQTVEKPVTEFDVVSHRDDAAAAKSKKSDKAVQVAIRVPKYFRSKATQCVSQVRDTLNSPFCYQTTTIATSPFKFIRCVSMPTGSVQRNLRLDEPGLSFEATQKISDSDFSFVPSSEKGTSESAQQEYVLKTEQEAF